MVNNMTDKTYITKEQIDQITKSIPELRNKAIFQTAYYGGLRLKELTELQKGDLDFKKDFVEINVSTGLSNRKVIVVEPKETLEEYIEKYDISDDEDCLWQSPDGSKMSVGAVRYTFRKICDSLDLDITFHTLRYSRALYLSHEMVEQVFYDFFGYSNSSDVIQRYRKMADSENLNEEEEILSL